MHSSVSPSLFAGEPRYRLPGRESSFCARLPEAHSAVRQLWNKANTITPGTRGSYFAVLASCYRAAGSIQDAEHCLEIASALVAGDIELSDWLLRKSFVLQDHGALDEALSLVEQAGGILARAGEWRRFGETFVAQSGFLIHQEDFRAAGRALEVAREYLPEPTRTPNLRERRTAFAIEHNSAIIARELKDMSTAHQHMKMARELAPDPIAAGVVWGQIAEFCKDAGRMDQAVIAYKRELELVARNPTETALVTIDLTDALVRCGRFREAIEIAQSVVSRVSEFNLGQAGNAAILRLWDQTRKNQLRSDTLQKVRVAIQKSSALPALTIRLRLFQRLTELETTTIAEMSGISVDTLKRIEAGSEPSKRIQGTLSECLFSLRPELRIVIA